MRSSLSLIAVLAVISSIGDASLMIASDTPSTTDSINPSPEASPGPPAGPPSGPPSGPSNPSSDPPPNCPTDIKNQYNQKAPKTQASNVIIIIQFDDKTNCIGYPETKDLPKIVLCVLPDHTVCAVDNVPAPSSPKLPLQVVSV